MLPNVDTIGGVVVSGGQGMAVRRQESDNKALEAYRAARDNEKKIVAQSAEREAAASAAAEKKATERIEKNADSGDQATINLQLTREEREAFAVAFGSEDKAETLSEEEKEVVRKASERIVKYVDEAIAQKKESRERVEKAVGEWYTRLSNGEPRGPTDLIQLFRQAALGQLDGLAPAQ